MSGIKQPFVWDPPEHVMWFEGQVTGHATVHAAPSVPMGPISTKREIKNYISSNEQKIYNTPVSSMQVSDIGQFPICPPGQVM